MSAGGTVLLCKAGSRIRKDGMRLVAGDRVTVECNEDGTGFIRSVEERKNSLVRPLVANIDCFVIVCATTEPKPYYYNIDKLTVMAEKVGVEICLAVNKCDLAPADGLINTYSSAAYKCFKVCAANGEGIEPLRSHLRGKVSVFAGASGVGKSSLLNALYPDLNTETGELSKKIGRGKNTTRHTEFFEVEENTYLADTPGFTMLDEDRLGIQGAEDLYLYFSDFEPFVGGCTFRGCTHLKEEGCAVIAAVEKGTVPKSRHDSYVKLYGELKNIKRY